MCAKKMKPYIDFLNSVCNQRIYIQAIMSSWQINAKEMVNEW